jgi:hypothetical protein
MPNMNRKTLAAEILSEVEREIKNLKMQIEVMGEELRNLESQRDAAQVLAGIKRSPVNTNVPGDVRVMRAKNHPDLVFQFLRDRCPDGATIPELYKMLVDAGVAASSRNYIYKVVNDLREADFIQKEPDGKYRVKSAISPGEWKQPGQVTQ